MKKIICLLLSLTLTVLSLAVLSGCGSCEAHVDADKDNLCDECGEEYIAPVDGVADTVAYYANSQPLKVETVAKHDYYEFDDEGNEFIVYTLNYNSVLKTGKVNGLIATVEREFRDIIDSIKSEDADGKIRPVIKNITSTEEFLQGSGRRSNGGEWVNGYNFAPSKGAIAINLDKANLQNVTYVEAPYNNVLTFTVPADKVEAVFGTKLTSDSAVNVSITNDGAVVTGIKVSYGIKAVGNYPKCLVVEEVKYDYSVQRVDLVS